jgi:putative redox protein
MGTSVTVRSGEGYTQILEAGGHRIVVDEPIDFGGADLGPNPYELLLGALGGCTSITLLMYARRKGWPLERVEVRLMHERVHAKDCADCETATGKIDTIYKDIVLEGPLTDEQRLRLLEIAGKCPVNRTLQSEIKIRDRLVALGEPDAAG